MKQLWRCDEESKELARSLVREAVEKMQAEFKERDEEMDHKFNLQVAENKRLQGHIGELKKENKHLCRTRVPRGAAAAAPPRAFGRGAVARRALDAEQTTRVHGRRLELVRPRYSQVVALQSRVKMLEEEIVGD